MSLWPIFLRQNALMLNVKILRESSLGASSYLQRGKINIYAIQQPLYRYTLKSIHFRSLVIEVLKEVSPVPVKFKLSRISNKN